MLPRITIVSLIALIFIFTSTVSAGVIDDSFSEFSFSSEHIDFYMASTNENAWFHEIKPDEPGKSHWHEKSARGELGATLLQGLSGKYITPGEIEVRIYRENNKGLLNMQVNFNLFLTFEKLETPPVSPQNGNFNLGGLNYWYSASIEFDEKWVWDKSTDTGYQELTDDLQVRFSTRLSNADIVNSNWTIEDELFGWGDGGLLYHGMSIRANFLFQLTGENPLQIPMANAILPLEITQPAPSPGGGGFGNVVPEPASLLIFSFAGIFMLSRRRSV